MKKVSIIFVVIILVLTVIFAMKKSSKYLLITQPKDTFYEFYLGKKKFFEVVQGKIKSILVNKNNPSKDFYFYTGDTFVKYPEKTSIKTIVNDNIMNEGNKHQGSIWPGNDGNIYKTTLILLPFKIVNYTAYSDLDCSEKGLADLFKKYKVSVTPDKCKKQKDDNWGMDAVCQISIYDKANNTWEIKDAVLTNTDACDTVGCSDLTYKNIDKNYQPLDNNVFTKEKLDYKFIKIPGDNTPYNVGTETDKYFIASVTIMEGVVDDKIYIIDKLKLRIVKTIEAKRFQDAIVKDNLLYIKTYNYPTGAVFIYDTKDFNLINRIDNVYFFDFFAL